MGLKQSDEAIATLLDLDGSVFEHGIRYSLTLHNRYGIRVMGYDNAHAVRPPGKFKFAGQRLPYDHKHRSASDKGVPYIFGSAQGLLEDFFAEVDKVIAIAIAGD